MRILSMVFFSILILVGCSTINPAVVVPPMEKYCPRPVRPVIEQKDVWTVQDILGANLVIIDYALKLEQTVGCWEGK